MSHSGLYSEHMLSFLRNQSRWPFPECLYQLQSHWLCLRDGHRVSASCPVLWLSLGHHLCSTGHGCLEWNPYLAFGFFKINLSMGGGGVLLACLSWRGSRFLNVRCRERPLRSQLHLLIVEFLSSWDEKEGQSRLEFKCPRLLLLWLSRDKLSCKKKKLFRCIFN